MIGGNFSIYKVVIVSLLISFSDFLRPLCFMIRHLDTTIPEHRNTPTPTQYDLNLNIWHWIYRLSKKVLYLGYIQIIMLYIIRLENIGRNYFQKSGCFSHIVSPLSNDILNICFTSFIRRSDQWTRCNIQKSHF